MTNRIIGAKPKSRHQTVGNFQLDLFWQKIEVHLIVFYFEFSRIKVRKEGNGNPNQTWRKAP
jgi:hypothetical protein